jgi:hypothetical protein
MGKCGRHAHTMSAPKAECGNYLWPSICSGLNSSIVVYKAYNKRRTKLSEQIPEPQRTISRDELFYTVQAASQILSWATDHHGMIFAHETPGFDPRTEPSWLAHLHHAQEDLSMALAEILPKDDPGSHGRGFIRA